MPLPKTSTGYSQVYLNLLELAEKKKGDTFQISFDDEKKAFRFRFAFYSFRKALANDIKKEKIPDRKKAFQEQLDIAASLSFIIKKEEDKFILNIIPSRKITSDIEIDINAQILDQLNIPEEDINTSIEDEYVQEGNSLDILGIDKGV